MVHIHGMAGNYYENVFLDAMAQALTEAGWALLCGNNRGHDTVADLAVAGETEAYKRIGGSREVFAESARDVAAWCDLAASRGNLPMVLQGHSLGAVKAAYYLAERSDSRVSGLILLSPPDMVALAESDPGHVARVAEATRMVAAGEGDEFLTGLLWDWYVLSANTFLDLTSRGRAVDVFNLYDPAAASALNHLGVPTLAVIGERDDVVTSENSETHLARIRAKLTRSPDFRGVVVRGASHVFFGCHTEMASAVTAWLRRARGPA